MSTNGYHVIMADCPDSRPCFHPNQFVEIGQNAFIAGEAFVRKDVPPYIKAVRNPLS